jgi:hypothetical protein
LINEKRLERLKFFKEQEERWIGSLNFVRNGEIAEKDMIMMHPEDDEAQAAMEKGENYASLQKMEAAEYASLSVNEKK